MTGPAPAGPAGGGPAALLDELRRVVAAADPVPRSWRRAARVAARWAGGDLPRARLVFEAEPDALGVRAPGRRELRFAAGGRAVAVTVDVDGEVVRLVGQLDPAGAAEVAAHWPEGSATAAAGADGRFHFDDLPRRPLCRVTGGEDRVRTSWFVP